MSSQKQNREGVAGSQSGQYRATAESSPGCSGGPSRDVIIWYQSHSAQFDADVPARTSGSP